jgi:hypothetical protein
VSNTETLPVQSPVRPCRTEDSALPPSIARYGAATKLGDEITKAEDGFDAAHKADRAAGLSSAGFEQAKWTLNVATIEELAKSEGISKTNRCWDLSVLAELLDPSQRCGLASTGKLAKMVTFGVYPYIW